MVALAGFPLFFAPRPEGAFFAAPAAQATAVLRPAPRHAFSAAARPFRGLSEMKDFSFFLCALPARLEHSLTPFVDADSKRLTSTSWGPTFWLAHPVPGRRSGPRAHWGVVVSWDERNQSAAETTCQSVPVLFRVSHASSRALLAAAGCGSCARRGGQQEQGSGDGGGEHEQKTMKPYRELDLIVA